MKFFTTLAAGMLAASASAVNVVNVDGQEFVDSVTGDRVYLIGIDYQPGGSAAYGTGQGDPLSNPASCLRDAALMQQLGINTIRCYNLEPTLNHDECVSIFNSVGIYMIIDVNSPLPGQAIDSSDPSSSYDVSYLNHIFSVVEAFKSYPNLIGFFAGNEVINQPSNAENCPPYIRAVTRDLKNYIAAHADRAIPVGYSAAQVQSVLYDTWAYLQCNITSGTGLNSNADFFGLNSYSWCGTASSYTTSGYNVLVDWFSNSSIPVFFSEYGCNVPSPRYFDEIPTLYGPLMTALSGGLAYQWTQDVNNYGLVQVNSNGSAQLLFDYYTFQSKLATVDVSLLTKANTTAETGLPAPSCNAALLTGGDVAGTSAFDTSFDIPAPPPGADAVISAGVTNPPTGSLVSVTATSATYPVYGSDGAQLSNLAITTGANAQNTPGSVSGSGSSSSGNSSSGSNSTGSSGKSAAVGGRAGFWVGVNAVVVGGVAAFAFLL